MQLFQVPEAVSRDVHVRLVVQPHDDAVLQPDRELHVSTAPQLQREGRSERGDLLQPLSLPRPVDVPVQGEDKTLDIHRETVCPCGAAKEGGDRAGAQGLEGDDESKGNDCICYSNAYRTITIPSAIHRLLIALYASCIRTERFIIHKRLNRTLMNHSRRDQRRVVIVPYSHRNTMVLQ